MKKIVQCQNCHRELNQDQRSLTCPMCSVNSVEFHLEKDGSPQKLISEDEQGIWRYKDFLPEFKKHITLGEGNTPIRMALHLFSKEIQLLFKLEGSNPTGSFQDRVSPLLVSDALTKKMSEIVCASDGNLGASLSAYCASAELKSICVVPKTISPEKKTQMVAHGAEVIEYGATIDESLILAQKMTDENTYQATPEFNILYTEGSKTISYEIIEQLLLKPNLQIKFPWLDYIVIPMGSGRLLYSIWKGFKQAQDFGFLEGKSLPKIIGVQVKDQALADAILARKSAFESKAQTSVKESKGTIVSITDKELLEASKKLGKSEGIFAEFSSATVIAAIEKLLKTNYFEKNATVLALITASGLKTSGAFQKTTSRDKKVESFRNLGTKIEILQLIASGEANFGYGIWKALGQSLSLQAIYQHLKELQTGEHIKEITSPDRQKRYQLTTKGSKLLQKMKELEELLP
ncbi:MAG: pyridoxal-phosphate dependent enzyme [Asgard group archaeon]|nr:pyridoxal-phosphate dependent enzyme [Asgard group archaeon]